MKKILSVLSFLTAVCVSLMASQLSTDTMRVDADLDRPVVPAGQAEDVVVQIKIHPHELSCEAERVPVNLSLVMDRSGSMGGDKMSQAIEAAQLAVSRLGPRDRVSIIIYDSEVNTLALSQYATRAAKGRMQDALAGITARGSTAIYAGLNQAAAEIRRYADAGYVNRMILLSDGLANIGPSKVADFRALGRAFANEDIVVSTVGLGLGFNEDIMTALADSGQGNTYFVEHANDLPRIFAGELGDALNVAATDIEIIVRPRKGARILRSLGREAAVENNVARFRMPQVYGGLEKLALLEVRAPEGVAGDVDELVEVEVVYTPVGATTKRQQQVSVPIRYTEDIEEVYASARPDVAQKVVVNRIAEAKEAAVLLADQGDRAAAAERLRSVASKVGSDYDFFSNDEISIPEERLSEEAREIESSGLSNVKRKSYRSDSYQSRNQQSIR